jgi:GMP synthase-like glutamine amidotransferase
MPTKGLLIVQHMPWEGPGGQLRAALAEAGVPYRVLEVWHEPLADVEDWAGMIVLGGSPNVDEEDRFPYLRPLKGLIREVVESGRAYLGFCLGHQLLGDVLGCRVGPLPRKSVGFIEGRLTPRGLAHPVFQGLPPRLELFKWHGQGVQLPLSHGLSILVHSAATPVEALGIIDNPRVVGLQFDNHVDAADVEAWLEADRDWALSGSGVAPAALVAAARAREDALGQGFRRLFRNFLGVAGLL